MTRRGQAALNGHALVQAHLGLPGLGLPGDCLPLRLRSRLLTSLLLRSRALLLLLRLRLRALSLLLRRTQLFLDDFAGDGPEQFSQIVRGSGLPKGGG